MIRCRLLLPIILASFLCPAASLAQIPAFPGAEGFGAVSLGGRGGDVYHVTNLQDDGPGSLRYGIENAAGPRTIVFDVGGTIALDTTLWIKKPYITIAGQTAPGDGICIRDHSLTIKRTNDIVIRYLRLRRGDVKVRANLAPRPERSTDLDVVSIDDSRNVIFDHCSLSWSCDEVFGIVQNENVTVQWCVISEPLGDPPLHPYGDRHAYGLNISANTISVHHNLISKFVFRGPQFEPNDARDGQGYDVLMESVNNVVFDYHSSGSRYKLYIEEYPELQATIPFRFHFVNNFYLRPSWRDAPDIQADRDSRYGITDQLRVYVSGNIGPSRPSADLDQWRSVRLDGGGYIEYASAEAKAHMSGEPLFAAPIPVTTHTAFEAYDAVIRDAGCSNVRDSVDLRVLDDVANRRYGEYLRSQDEVGGWPELRTSPPPPDTDLDGIPDAWEDAHQLDRNDPSDGTGDADADGYTNLEQYLNGVVESAIPTRIEQRGESHGSGRRLGSHPNPFNGGARISYAVPRSETVEISLYNLAGQLVRCLVNDARAPGDYVTLLSGDGLASGVYLVRMSTGDDVLVRRISLAK